MDWQIELLQTIQSFKNPFLDVFFQAITITAEETFFIVIAAWFLWCYNKRAGYRIGFAFLTSTILNPFLKSIFQFNRPIGVEGVESMRTHTATGSSFPSGHTQGATSFWVGVMLFFKKRWVWVLSITMFLLVGFSRLYLGVHWLTDILGGFIFAIVWVVFVTFVFDFSRKRNTFLYIWLILVPFVIAYLMPFFTGNATSDDHSLIVSLGSSIGFLLGFMFEEKYIHFDVKSKFYQHIIKLVIGIAITFLIKEGFKFILPFNPRIADLIRYVCLGFWLTGAAPLVFKKLGLEKKQKPIDIKKQ